MYEQLFSYTKYVQFFYSMRVSQNQIETNQQITKVAFARS